MQDEDRNEYSLKNLSSLQIWCMCWKEEFWLFPCNFFKLQHLKVKWSQAQLKQISWAKNTLMRIAYTFNFFFQKNQ